MAGVEGEGLDVQADGRNRVQDRRRLVSPARQPPTIGNDGGARRVSQAGPASPMTMFSSFAVSNSRQARKRPLNRHDQTLRQQKRP